MITILGAMDCEISLLLGKMTETRSEKIGKHTFYTGQLAGHDCALAQCGVGKVNAATAAAVMIQKYRPSAIINIGVGGGLAPDLSVGEAIAASALCTHDLDYGILGDARGTVFYPDGEDIIMLPTDQKITDALVAAAKKLGIACRRGVVASGDRFVSSPEVRSDIRAAFGADVCEMEGSAVAQVAYAFGVPFAVLRSVSDLADGSAPASFDKFAKESADTAAKLLIGALGILGSDL